MGRCIDTHSGRYVKHEIHEASHRLFVPLVSQYEQCKGHEEKREASL